MAKQSGSRSARVARKKPAPSTARRPAKTAKPARRASPELKTGLRQSERFRRVRAHAAQGKVRAKVPERRKAQRATAKGASAVAMAPPNDRERALAVFERAFQALQQRQFRKAADLLAVLVSDYPEEKELHERARVYLTICQRQMAPPSHAPRTYDDRVCEATLAINQGSYDEGLALLRQLEAEHDGDDHVQYMLCVVHSLRGELDDALAHLRLAIDLNPEKRYLATQDADLETLRQQIGFTAALDAPSSRRRTAVRRK